MVPNDTNVKEWVHDLLPMYLTLVAEVASAYTRVCYWETIQPLEKAVVLGGHPAIILPVRTVR